MRIKRDITIWFTALLSFSAALHAQISLTSAVELALKNSPRVRTAQAEVDKARAVVDESRDVYIPSLNAGAGLGQSYGYTPNPPTLFTFNAQSLVYNASQFSYIRAARNGVRAALLTYQDARQAVAEETALTFVALDRDQQRESILRDEMDLSGTLVNIAEERFKAGRDSRIDFTNVQLTQAQLRLANLRARDETEDDRERLRGLLGIGSATLRAEGGFPATPIPASTSAKTLEWVTPAVGAAFLNAESKHDVALGDARYLYRPQVSLIVQYNRYATYTNSFKQINNGTISANEGVFGVQINIPLVDRFRLAKNRESSADAARALHEAETAQMAAHGGQSKLRHSIEQLQARAEIATLQQQLAQQQLEVLAVQLQSPPVGATALTPKDEQNARIAEREKALAVLETTFQLRQAQITLLRQTGQLEEWLNLPPKPLSRIPIP